MPEKPKPSPPEKRAESSKAAKQAAQSKEDKLRMMINKDPEKAAELLRKLFLSND